jgi:hypothetical protein
LVQGGVTKKVTASNFLLPSDIGSTVQAYDVDTAKLDVAQTFTAAQTFNNTLGVGGATPSASGAGVTFPATQSASSNANTLDDYEEGTWTPAVVNGIAGPTYSIQEGTYVKIGRLVYATARLAISSGTTNTGGFRISLPFTHSASTNELISGSTLRFSSATSDSFWVALLRTTSEAATGFARDRIDASPASTAASGNNFGSTGDIQFTLCYQVD